MFKSKQSEKIKLVVNCHMSWFKGDLELVPSSSTSVSCGHFLITLRPPPPGVQGLFSHRDLMSVLVIKQGIVYMEWDRWGQEQSHRRQERHRRVSISRHHVTSCDLMVLTGVNKNTSGWGSALTAPASGLGWYWFLGLTPFCLHSSSPSPFPAHLCK